MFLMALVDCAGCGTAYQGCWTAEADTLQDLDEAPVSVQQCPCCGHSQQETWPGWINYTEAG